MIMSETDLRISKVLYIGTMNVIVIFFCFCKLILFCYPDIYWVRYIFQKISLFDTDKVSYLETSF